ncbi:MAG: PKD domain-containing protein, partial [Bacteroidota bacterium]
MRFFFIKLILFFSLCLLYITKSTAQQVYYKEKPVSFVQQRSTGFDEKVLRERMAADGLPVAVADKLVEQHRLLWEKGLHVQWSSAQNIRNGNGDPVTCAVCNAMSGESGWGAWQGAVGDNSNGNPPLWGPLGTPSAPNFTLNSGPGLDICTPGFNPNDPPLPLVAPGFGSTSILLGEQQMAGSITEQLVYPLTVAVTDTNFIYAYALVLEDAGHPDGERPFAEFVMLNPSGDTIPCAYFHYEGADPMGAALPGFFQGTCGAKYKPWTTVGVNLSAYVGQTVTLIITNADCIWGAHFAQSYWDFNCGILQGSSSTDCYGVADTLRGPDDPSINYTYHWYPGGQTTQNIIVYPQPGDTFMVAVQPPTGCSFYEIFVPQPQGIHPNFTYTATCGAVNFHDNSTTSSGLPIIAWHWSFPGGNPSSSTQQNPVVTYVGGNFTATLIVTAQSGCIDTVTLSGIATSASPVAAFTGMDVCFGNATAFTDHSTPVGNDPIVAWHWGFGDGVQSALQNPSHIYTVANTYTVTLTVTSAGGCSSSVANPFTVHPMPVANFSAPPVCESFPTVFNDLSSASPTQWYWTFGDGGISISQDPLHTYTSSGTFNTKLIAITAHGCRDTVTLAVIVNPEPLAQFSSLLACPADTTCFSDLSTISSGDILSWEWNFGDTLSGASNNSTQANPCHTFTTGANLNPVVLKVTSDQGCIDLASHPVSFYALPVAAFSANRACVGDPTCFTDLSAISFGSITSWQWNFGDVASDSTNFSDDVNPCHTFTPGASLDPVLLTVTSNHGCATSASISVSFYQLPLASFTSNAVCLNNVSHFTDLSEPSEVDDQIHLWNWNFGDSSVASSNQNPDHLYSDWGTFDAQLV